ncbi:amino acid ABC transporter permease, partial [Bacillus siamensis]
MDTLKELFTYYAQNGSYVLYECWRHFLMSAYGVVFAAAFAIPAG